MIGSCNLNTVYTLTNFPPEYLGSAINYICILRGKVHLFSEVKVNIREDTGHQSVMVKLAV